MFKGKTIPLSVPVISGNEWVYVKDCLETGWLSPKGKYVSEFESRIASYVGSRNAVACINGTSALHISLVLVGVEKGDEVIVPTLTFIAPINAVRYLYADPIFMDSDEYYNIDVEKTIEFINKETIFRNGYTYNRKSGKKIKAIVVVHIFGNAVELEKLIPICKKRNIKIVEDASESLGTYFNGGNLRGKFTGSIGDFGCYSFNVNKIITTGGGGMIVTNNDECANKAKYLSMQAKDDEKRYIHNEIGYNYRMNNVGAALGLAQFEQLENFLKIKKNNYLLYKEIVNSIEGLTMVETPPYACSNYWFYCLRVDKNKYRYNSSALGQFLASNNIETRPLWTLNHLQKPYINCQSYEIENAIKQWEDTINLPCSVNLTKEDIIFIANKLLSCHEL